MHIDARTIGLAGLAIMLAGGAGSVSASAAVPTLTVTGTFGAAPELQLQSPAFLNLAELNNQAFSLELRFLDVPVYDGAQAIDDLPGETIHAWDAGQVAYTLLVNGSPLLSGVLNGGAEAFDDITPTATFLDALPAADIINPLIQAGGTYDGVLIEVFNIPLGCVNDGGNGICDQPGEVFEGASLYFDYAWDTASKNAMTSLPADSATIPSDFFTGGQGIVGLYVWRYDGIAGEDIAIHGGLASTVSISAPVPEAETWAMMLAGLGLVGWSAMRRRQQPA